MARLFVIVGFVVMLCCGGAQADQGCPSGQFPDEGKRCTEVSKYNTLPLDESQPMRFEALQMSLHTVWLQATGTITEDTPALFRKFLQSDDGQMSKHLSLDSLGGNLMAGLELGEIIRKAGLNTRIGRSISLDGAMNVYEYPMATCASACAYTFLGGVTRAYDDKDVYGLHRFGSDEIIVNGDVAQVVSGIVAKYIERMGIDLDVLKAASSASFEKDLFVVPVTLATQMRIIYDPSGRTSFHVEMLGDSIVVNFHFSAHERDYEGIIACSPGDRLIVIYDDHDTVPNALRGMLKFPAEFGSNTGKLSATATYVPVKAGNTRPFVAFHVPQLTAQSFEGGLTLTDIRNPTVKPLGNGPNLAAGDLVRTFQWLDAVDAFAFKIVPDNAMKTLPIVFRQCT